MLALSQFVSPQQTLVARHHVVVLEKRGEQALILPTSTIDGDAHRALNVAGEVNGNDRQLAGWPNRCRFVVEALQWVPVSWLSERPGTRLSKQTTEQLKMVAKRFGPAAPRYQDETIAQLSLQFARKSKQRIAA